MEADVAQFKKDAVSMATSPKTTQLVHSVIERASLLLCMDTEPGQVRQPAPQPSQGTARCVCACVCVRVCVCDDVVGCWSMDRLLLLSSLVFSGGTGGVSPMAAESPTKSARPPFSRFISMPTSGM